MSNTWNHCSIASISVAFCRASLHGPLVHNRALMSPQYGHFLYLLMGHSPVSAPTSRPHLIGGSRSILSTALVRVARLLHVLIGYKTCIIHPLHVCPKCLCRHTHKTKIIFVRSHLECNRVIALLYSLHFQHRRRSTS